MQFGDLLHLLYQSKNMFFKTDQTRLFDSTFKKYDFKLLTIIINGIVKINICILN